MSAAIWEEFWESGPDGKPPVIRLMAKYNKERWYLADSTSTASNNRKNTWGKRHAPS
jgi:hypothetical protein